MTDVIDDPSGPDTPGPEASADQDALVRGLLGALRTDDPPMPDHVTARLDAVLAEVRRQAPVPIGRAGALADLDDDRPSDGGGHTTGVAPVTVLPTPRRGPSSRSFRLLAGAAAAVVVVGGAAVVVRGGGLGGDSSTSGGATAAMADSAGAYVRSTGTAYTRTGLAAQASALVSQTRSAPLTSDVAAPEIAGGQSAAKRLLTAATIPACVEQLAGRPGVVVVAVDQATYEGKAANVIVLPAEGDITTLEVWVVGPGCTKDDADLLEWQSIPAP